MKICPKCLNRYSDMWNICMVCKTQLKKRSSYKKISAKTRPDSNIYLNHIENMIDQADTLFIYLDKNLKPIVCSQAMEDITGYKREKAYKGDWLNLLFKGRPSRKKMFKAAITSCLYSIKSRTYESEITRKDGSKCILSWRTAAVTDKDGNISGIICTAHDITEKKSFEDEVTIKSERLRNIFSSIKGYALMASNLDGKITYYGKGSGKFFGWRKDMTLKDIYIIFPFQEREAAKKRINSALKKHAKFEEEVVLFRNNKEQFPAILAVFPLYDNHNNKTGYVYIASDITERKRLERQIIQSEKLAAIGQLAAGVAHEISSPLVVITGRLDMLAMEGEKLTPEVQRVVDIIKHQAQRMRNITERLLTYSRQRILHMGSVNVNEVLKTIKALLEYHPEYKNIRWMPSLGKGLPSVEADFNQLQEVFLNIALNACQAMPNGGAIIVESEYNKEGFVEIGIKDTGSGIRKRDLDRLFTPFFTSKKDGVGLGLSICQSIISLHGGKIEVDSKLEKGSIFKVSLPVNMRGKR